MVNMPTDLPETNANPAASKGTLTGWHILTIFIVGFGIVFTVNGIFIYKAISTNSGEIQHAYMEGLKFNETLETREKQKSLGWDMTLSMQRGAGGDALFTAQMLDKANQPVAGLNMNGILYRNTENKDDHKLVFKEVKTGIYEAVVPQLGPGKWLFEAKATKAGEPDFTTETSLSIR